MLFQVISLLGKEEQLSILEPMYVRCYRIAGCLPQQCALIQVGIARDHTLFSLVEGRVQFSRVARRPLPPQKGRKWIKKPWRKFANVVSTEQPKQFVLLDVIQPPVTVTQFS